MHEFTPTRERMVESIIERLTPLRYIADAIYTEGHDDTVAARVLAVGVRTLSEDLECLFEDARTWQTAETLSGGAA